MITKNDLILDIPHESGMNFDELISLGNFIQREKPKRILEIGTKYGRTTINMAKFAPEDCEIVSVDLIPLDYSFVYKYPESKKIKFIQGDSLKFDFSKLGYFDVVLVDANHLYNFVQNDTKIALNSVKQDGYILWHDYGKVGPQYSKIQVKQALDDMKIKPDMYLGWSLVGLQIR